MTIVEFMNKLELLIDEVKPKDASDDDMFYNYEYDSDTHWIKLGIPPDWLDHLVTVLKEEDE